MPIKPENKHLYPDNWQEIRERILERAGNRCEGSPAFPDCRAKNGVHGYRNEHGDFIECDGMMLEVADLDGEKIIKIVLTIGHIDHDPTNNDESNLAAWCQKCHLTHDADQHARSAAITRKLNLEKAGQTNMFGECVN